MEATVERFYRGAFSQGTGGLVEYWRDVSLGKVDISGSRVFGWIEVDLPRSKANIGSGVTRSTLVDAAITAVQRKGMDPLTGFHSQFAIYTENWSIDGIPPGLDWSDPYRGQFWIDGSADRRGKVTLTPPHDGNITAHEMGHGFGMGHDRTGSGHRVPRSVPHHEPAALLRAAAVERPVRPALCLPHLVQQGWMYPRRLYVDPGGWVNQPDGISVPLAALVDPGARANLGIELVFSWITSQWHYFVQYVTPTDWNRGLQDSFVISRRGHDQTPAYLGSIQVPAASGAVARFVEPAGRVMFTVERFTDDAGSCASARSGSDDRRRDDPNSR